MNHTQERINQHMVDYSYNRTKTEVIKEANKYGDNIGLDKKVIKRALNHIFYNTNLCIN